MLAVTSFNPDKQKYGFTCLESLVKFFPGRIVAFTESPIDIDGVECRPLMRIPGIEDYLQKIKRVSGSNGHADNRYDYRYDADKFCRKVFAQDQVFPEDQFVFWFDADCEVLKEIPEDFLKGLVADAPFAYLGRKNYTETGWIGFNTHHPKFKDFRAKYLSAFTSGRIFQQKEWHDCIAFDLARQGIKGNDLGKGATMGHVLLKSVLAPFLDHKKGGRKEIGYSPGHPYNDPNVLAKI